MVTCVERIVNGSGVKAVIPSRRGPFLVLDLSAYPFDEEAGLEENLRVAEVLRDAAAADLAAGDVLRKMPGVEIEILEPPALQ